MATKPAREDRISGDQLETDPRSPFQVDRDRILYSMPFRRLAGVTQVVSPEEGIVFHNRLTHSIKVAQVARRMAEHFRDKHGDAAKSWGGIEPDVVEAAALAHDLGHPPFGHIAEYELNRLCQQEVGRFYGFNKDSLSKIEGYEGNAQSFRLITELAIRRKTETNGLDLTRATLNATLKYPWRFLSNSRYPKKYGVYSADQKAFEFAKQTVTVQVPLNKRCVEAQIMDWADDIAYSVHDTEDFYRAGLLPLELLKASEDERKRYRKYLLDKKEITEEDYDDKSAFTKEFDGLFANRFAINDRYNSTKEQQHTLYSFVSDLIGEFLRETKLLTYPGNDHEALEISPRIQTNIKLLKKLTWKYVIDNPSLAATQLGQRAAITTLFEEFNKAAIEKRWELFPPPFRERGSAEVDCKDVYERVRFISDTIASLTDLQASMLYHRFLGTSRLSMLTNR